MEKTKVPVHYYTLYPYSEHEEARDAASTTLFPHAKGSATFVSRGSSRKPDTGIIYVCFESREARRKWELKNDDKD